MSAAGRLVVATGLALVLVGTVMILAGRGLPGTILIRRGSFTFAFPILASLVASVVLTLLLNLLLRDR